MNERICAYYSEGSHYTRTVRCLREAYPDADITAMAPPDYPVSDEVRTLATGVQETELAHFSPRDIPACRRLVGHIRAQRFDIFAVMFDSNQLTILASLSGAPRCLHGTIDGRLTPLPASVTVAIGAALGRAIWGRMVYSAAWLAVHLLPVGKPGDN